ncbi:MAG: hypothetical protein WAU58_11200 [Terriglobales bacterium]|jgi:hypothetical protein
MRTHAKPHDERSPLSLLTELAVEGTSSLVEAQRTLLNLAKQENDIVLNGVKERIGGFMPAVAMTDLVQRSLDTLIGMQQELLTTTNKQALELLESKGGKSERTAQLVEFAHEGVEAFTHAQKKFLDVVAEETAKATRGKPEHNGKSAKKSELTQLAREAGNAFVEAQKRLLDVMGQQMNVNLDVASRTLDMMSPSRLLPMANLTSEGVRNFVDRETALIGSIVKPPKKVVAHAKHSRPRATRRHKAVPA